MSDNDSIKAADITTANFTTDLVAEWIWDGPVVFRVGPSNNSTDGLVPDKTLDGVQGAGNLGGSGLVGIGGHYLNDQSSGIGVLGFGGPRNPLSQVSAPAGVGVKGVAGGLADGVVGTSDAASKSGVFGFNSLSSTHTDIAGYGVFGLCNTVGGVGVAGESKDGIGSRGHSAENNGVVGLSDAENKSGISSPPGALGRISMPGTSPPSCAAISPRRFARVAPYPDLNPARGDVAQGLDNGAVCQHVSRIIDLTLCLRIKATSILLRSLPGP
jgi:hypothetical protein